MIIVRICNEKGNKSEMRISSGRDRKDSIAVLLNNILSEGYATRGWCFVLNIYNNFIILFKKHKLITDSEIKLFFIKESE